MKKQQNQLKAIYQRRGDPSDRVTMKRGAGFQHNQNSGSVTLTQ